MGRTRARAALPSVIGGPVSDITSLTKSDAWRPNADGLGAMSRPSPELAGKTRLRRVEMWRGGGRTNISVATPHMGVIRSRGFVPSFSPFVSDPKSEPSVIRSGFRCSYQPHIRSPLVGGRTNIPLTGGQGLKRTRPIFRSAFQGQRGGFKARGAGRSSTWIAGTDQSQ